MVEVLIEEMFGSDCNAQEGTTVERPTHAAKNHKEFVHALLRSASGELLPSWQRPIMEVGLPDIRGHTSGEGVNMACVQRDLWTGSVIGK